MIQSSACKLPQHVQRARAPRRSRAAAAEDQLLGLHEKLDLADAAAPQFDVMAGDRDLGMALGRVNLPLHRMDVGDGRVIEIFAPDEGGHLAEEVEAQRKIARHRARLDHGGALPVLAERLVIMPRGVERDGGGGRAGIGPQAQVDAQHIAVAGALLQQLDQMLDDAQRIGLDPRPRAEDR